MNSQEVKKYTIEVLKQGFPNKKTLDKLSTSDSGNLLFDGKEIKGDGSGTVVVDDKLDLKSENPVQNKVITTRLNEVFQSVSDGKSEIAAAITDKGVPTDVTATFSAMATNISNIPTGGSGTVTDAFTISGITNDKMSIFSKVELGVELSVDLLDFPFTLTSITRQDNMNFSVDGNFSNFGVGTSRVLKSKAGFLFDGNLKSINTLTRTDGMSLVPIMSSNSQDGYVASCSDCIDNNRKAYRAFDGEIITSGNEWHSASSQFPHWLQIELPTSKILQKIILTNRDISNDYSQFNLGTNPKNIDIMASNDGVLFTTLDSVVCTNGGSAETNEFTITGATAYKYYRLRFNNNQSNGTHTYVTVGEWKLIGY